MEVTAWEIDDFGRVIAETQKRPPICKNERHNFFREIIHRFPTDSKSTLSVYGIFEVSECQRCGRLQKRYQVPEGPDDVEVLIKLLDEFTRMEKKREEEFLSTSRE